MARAGREIPAAVDGNGGLTAIAADADVRAALPNNLAPEPTKNAEHLPSSQATSVASRGASV
jgi:hypothetical protein